MLTVGTESQYAEMIAVILLSFGLVLTAIIWKLVNDVMLPLGLVPLMLPILATPLLFWYRNIGDYYIAPKFLTDISYPLMLLASVHKLDTYIVEVSKYQIIFIAIIGGLTMFIIEGFIMSLVLHGQFNLVVMWVSAITIASTSLPFDIMWKYERLTHLNTLLVLEVCVHQCLIYIIELSFLVDHDADVSGILLIIFRSIIVSVILGIIFGMIVVYAVSYMYNDTLNVSVTILATCYFATFLSKTMRSIFNPMIAVLAVSHSFNRVKPKLPTEVLETVAHFVETLQVVVETVVVLFCSFSQWCAVFNHVRLTTILLGVCMYVIDLGVRFMVLLSVCPIVNRIGYPISFEEMFILHWAAQKGLVQVVESYVNFYVIPEAAGNYYTCTLIVILMNYLINGLTVRRILTMLGMLDMVKLTKINIAKAFRILYNKKIQVVSVLKMNRIHCDINWNTVYDITMLKNIYQSYENVEESFMLYETEKCPSCFSNIEVPLNINELKEKRRSIKMTILRIQKMSFSRQLENGMITGDAMSALTHAVKVAFDSKDLYIKVEGLTSMLNSKQSFRDKVITIGVRFLKSEENYNPSGERYKTYYYIIRSLAFDICHCLISAFYIAINSYCIYAIHNELLVKERKVITILDMLIVIPYIMYFTEFVIRCIVLSEKKVLEALKIYSRSFWDMHLIIILVYMTVCLGFNMKLHIRKEYSASEMKVYTLLTIFQIIAYLRIFKIFYRMHHLLFKFNERRLDRKLSKAVGIGIAMILAYDEVYSVLHYLALNKAVIDELYQRLNYDRLHLTRCLAIIQKNRPWISVTLKTKRAINICLKYQLLAIKDLTKAGLIDIFENNTLRASLFTKQELLSRLTVTSIVAPARMFYEISWLVGDDDNAAYLYQNAEIKIFNKGDVIYKPGDYCIGVFIITAGFFKVIYSPTMKEINECEQMGFIPIMDVLCNTQWNEYREEYLMVGNTFGELSFLTGRPYTSTVIAESASLVFMIPPQAIENAIKSDIDPVYGLSERMWKHVCIGMTRRMLAGTQAYISRNLNQISVILEQSFVPNITPYKLLVKTELLQDIIVLDGYVVDYNTREIFTAPCCLPRSISKIAFPHSYGVEAYEMINSKIMFIPVLEMNPYFLMELMENVSELMPDVDKDTLVKGRVNMLQSRRFSERMMVSSSAMGRMSNYYVLAKRLASAVKKENSSNKNMSTRSSTTRRSFSDGTLR